MLTLMLAAALAAPAPPVAPTMRAFAELPIVTPRAGFLQTDAEAVELVRSVVGPLARDQQVIPVVFTDTAAQPTYANGVVSLQRFATRDVAWVRRELADGALPSVDLTSAGTDADLLEAWHAAHLAALANAFAHAIRDSWGRLDDAHPEAEDALARTLEGPVLDALAAEGRIPARWPELYRRLTGAAATGQTLDAALIETLGYYPDLDRDQLTATLGSFATTAGLGAPVPKHEDDGPLIFSVSGDAGAVALWKFGDQTRIRAAAPIALSYRQRKKAAQVVNSWNQDVRGFTVIIQPLNVLILTGPFTYVSTGDLRTQLDATWEVLNIVTPALAGLADGASVDDTINVPQGDFEAKGLYAW